MLRSLVGSQIQDVAILPKPKPRKIKNFEVSNYGRDAVFPHKNAINAIVTLPRREVLTVLCAPQIPHILSEYRNRLLEHSGDARHLILCAE